MNQPCPGSTIPVTLQGNLEIAGEPATPGEDFVAVFDMQGYVIGNSGIEEISGGEAGCPAPVSFVNMVIYGDASAANENSPTCPDNWGADPGEVITGLAYDGSTELYYEIGFDYTFNSADGVTEIFPGDFCRPAMATVLPVTLQSFTGYALTGKRIQLDWTSAQEENVSHYEVERSGNGSQWETIGSVDAAGDSDVAVSYDFIDDGSLTPNNFYRLNMVDVDGTSEQSGIVIVTIDATGGDRQVTLFPNPISANGSQLSIQLQGDWAGDAPISARLFDARGRNLQTYEGLRAGTSAVALPAGTTAGIYLLRTTQGDVTLNQKLLIH